jgi:hypothetical protein
MTMAAQAGAWPRRGAASSSPASRTPSSATRGGRSGSPASSARTGSGPGGAPLARGRCIAARTLPVTMSPGRTRSRTAACRTGSDLTAPSSACSTRTARSPRSPAPGLPTARQHRDHVDQVSLATVRSLGAREPGHWPAASRSAPARGQAGPAKWRCRARPPDASERVAGSRGRRSGHRPAPSGQRLQPTPRSGRVPPGRGLPRRSWRDSEQPEGFPGAHPQRRRAAPGWLARQEPVHGRRAHAGRRPDCAQAGLPLNHGRAGDVMPFWHHEEH